MEKGVKMKKLIKLNDDMIDDLFHRLTLFNEVQEKDYKKENLDPPKKDFLLKSTDMRFNVIDRPFPEIDLEIFSFDRNDRDTFKELLKDCFVEEIDYKFYPLRISNMVYEKRDDRAHLRHKPHLGLTRFYHKEYGEWYNNGWV